MSTAVLKILYAIATSLECESGRHTSVLRADSGGGIHVVRAVQLVQAGPDVHRLEVLGAVVVVAAEWGAGHVYKPCALVSVHRDVAVVAVSRARGHFEAAGALRARAITPQQC